MLFLALALPASAQIPPSAAERQACWGLHAAAARGDIAEIEKLANTGAAIDGRDGNGRTPLHVAAFMSKQDAARTLMRLGADANALEAQQYDPMRWKRSNTTLSPSRRLPTTGRC